MSAQFMKKLALTLALAVPAAACAETLNGATLYKNPNCGCCEAYAEYLRRAGFAVKVVSTQGMASLKQKLQVPTQLGSCHTTVIGNYVVEGHVPIASVKRLLKEKPAIKGIAVPGMPAGSPGMEAQVSERYTVFTFNGSSAPKAHDNY